MLLEWDEEKESSLNIEEWKAEWDDDDNLENQFSEQLRYFDISPVPYNYNDNDI